jgi:ligand-binding SRPBCC domain-containing protein
MHGCDRRTSDIDIRQTMPLTLSYGGGTTEQSSMVKILLETWINAPVERVFDLSRSIDAHTESASTTQEKAVAGKTSGLIGPGETVTWSAVHFGLRQRLTVRITEFERPTYFVDEMVSGAFKSMRHRHELAEAKGGTLMTDTFEFEAPLGWLGRVVECLVLESYMRRFLETRNAHLKALAESNSWQRFLEA